MPPAILDSVKRGQACELAAMGLSRREVARRIGCSSRTLRRERLRNPEFADCYASAEAATLARPLEHLKRHARTNWRAAAWLLERTEPQQFASRRTVLCRPREVQEACLQVVEAALQEVADLDQRVAMFRRLDKVVDEVCEALVHPCAASRAVLRRPTPVVDLTRLRVDRAAGQKSDSTGQQPDSAGQEADTWRTSVDDLLAELQPKQAGNNGASRASRLRDVSA